MEARAISDPGSGLRLAGTSLAPSSKSAPARTIRQVLMSVEALIFLFPANIPVTLKKPAEVGWQDDQWKDYENPMLAEVFNKLEREGLPLPV